MTVDPTADVLRRRVAGQHLAGNGRGTAVEVVRDLTCVQSQEWAHAFWSLGMRTQGLTYAQVRAEFDAGVFVRTHILRPTWHYVAAEDLRWIQAVTADRVHQLNGTMYRREGLGQRELDRGLSTIARELAGSAGLTRAELGRVLSATGQPLVYLIMNAELEGVICSGPIRGAQHTYVLVEERIHDHAEGDTGELAYRFFAGHGPASVKDLARWSSLTVTQSQDALDAVADRLDREVVEGSTLYSVRDSDPPGDPPTIDQPRALLLPLYDELTLSYPALGFPRADEHPHPPGVDRFVGLVIIDRVDVGTWRRTVKGKKMIMELALAPGVGPDGRRAAETESRRLADFLGLELVLG